MPKKHLVLVSTSLSNTNTKFFKSYASFNTDILQNRSIVKEIKSENYTLDFSLTSEIAKPGADTNFIIFYSTSELTSLGEAKNLGLAIRHACDSKTPITLVGLRSEPKFEGQQIISYNEGLLAAAKIRGNISFTECSLDKIEEMNAVIETSVTGMPPSVMRDYLFHIDCRLGLVEKLDLTAKQETLIDFLLKILREVSYEDKASQYFLMIMVTQLWVLKDSLESENKGLVDDVLKIVKATINKYCGSPKEIDVFASQIERKQDQIFFKSFFEIKTDDKIKKSSPLSRSMSEVFANKQPAVDSVSLEVVRNITTAIEAAQMMVSNSLRPQKN